MRPRNRRSNRLRNLALALACAATFAAIDAAAALGSSVTVSSTDRLSVTTSGNERNDFVIVYDAGLNAYAVTDTAGINPNGPCTRIDADTASCPAAGVGGITVNAGAANDTILLATLPTVEANLNGGTGDDRITAGPAADAIDGDQGADQLDGGNGADDLRGGSGRDLVSYSGRLTTITATIGSGVDDDGNELDQTGLRRDTIRGDIEQLLSGEGADVIFGDESGETLIGGGGPDRIFGQGGNDGIDGGFGDDVLSGSFGGDTLIGGPDNDQLFGGPQSDLLSGSGGNDRLVGKKGRDRLNGKEGIDRIFAKDGARDFKLNCGSGNNKREGAKLDKKLDPKAKSC